MTEDTDRQWHESPEYRQEQLSAALDGMLTPDEQAALDAHLAGCESCCRELEELRQVRSLLRAAPEPALPRSFLLPLEGDLPAPRTSRTSHTPPATSAPETPRTPAPVTPLQPAPGREPTRVRATRTTRTSRTLEVTRWIGTIAAILGLALFIGTLLPQMAHQTNSASSGAPYGANAPTGAGANATNSTKAPLATGDVNGHGSAPQVAVTATATSVAHAPTATSGATEATRAYSAPPGPSLADILRVAALVLLFAGAAVAIASLVVARRM